MDLNLFQSLWARTVPVLASISVEPVFFLDGFAYSIMVVLVESLQFDKICKVNLNYTEEICKDFDGYPEEEDLYNAKVSSFKRNDGAITSIIPLFFILFIGAWSDRYGRKVPLCLTLFCHILFSGGYLLNAWLDFLPVECLLVVGFLDSVGGGAVAFLTVSNAYISDVTTHEQRTSRVALANSLWFLGGPMGTLIGTLIFKASGYTAVFSTALILYIVALTYVIMLLPESHGPFCDKERLKKIRKPKPTIRLRDTILRVYGMSKKNKNNLGKTQSEEERNLKSKLTPRKMFLDFFDIKRVVLSFKCVFRKRDGFVRLFIFLLILSNFLRKIGRGAYVFYFTREVLKWEPTDYGYWSTYKNFISTMGSLFVVPILSTRVSISDNALAMIGSISSVADYVLYGLASSTTAFLMWIGPGASILVNSCSIAMRALMSKYVNSDELGQVSAVTGTLEGVVPIISTSLYSAITKATFKTFPGAQYFFGAACNVLMTLIFMFVMTIDRGETYDLEKAKPAKPKGPVREKTIVVQKDSNWLYDTQNHNKVRISTILLTDFNFSIEVPSIERIFSRKGKKLSNASELEERVEYEIKEEVQIQKKQTGDVSSGVNKTRFSQDTKEESGENLSNLEGTRNAPSESSSENEDDDAKGAPSRQGIEKEVEISLHSPSIGEGLDEKKREDASSEGYTNDGFQP